MEFSAQDKRLLGYLDHSAREPISKIAKECKLSREQVNYKIKKFKESGLIKNFMTFFNYPKFGYNLTTVVFLKLKNKTYIKKLKLAKNTISHTTVIGEYDYSMIIVSKDEKDFEQKLLEFARENKDEIKDYNFIKPYFMEIYDLKFLKINKPRHSFITESEQEEITKQDFKILKLLEQDARIKIIEIAKKLNISAELALYRLRNLQKKNIILGTKIHFDMTKLDYNYSAIQIDIENFSKTEEEKLKQFAREHKNVNSLMLSINSPQIMIQLFNKTQDELMNVIKKIKEILNNIKTINILFPEQEEQIKTLADLELDTLKK